MDSIVLLYDRGKIIRGKVTYYEDWYERWKAGLSDGEIMSIEFNEDETPIGLTKEDIQGVYDQADREFKNKMGVNYEEFCRAGKPSYREVMEAKSADDELKFKQVQNGVRPDRKPIIEIMADTAEVKRQLDELKNKLDEESKKYQRGLRAKGNFIEDSTGLDLEDVKALFDSLYVEESEVKNDKEKATDAAYERLNKIAEEYVVHKEILKEAMKKEKKNG